MAIWTARCARFSAKLGKTIEEAGGELGVMVTMTVFITDARYGGRFTQLRREIFGDNFPAGALIPGGRDLARPELRRGLAHRRHQPNHRTFSRAALFDPVMAATPKSTGSSRRSDPRRFARWPMTGRRAGCSSPIAAHAAASTPIAIADAAGMAHAASDAGRSAATSTRASKPRHKNSITGWTTPR